MIFINDWDDGRPLMKWVSIFVLLFVIFSLGCAHNAAQDSLSVHASSPFPTNTSSSPDVVSPAENSNDSAKQAGDDVYDDYSENDDAGDYGEYQQEVKPDKFKIADPFEPFNRAMFQFNDRLYFWVFRPVARGYKRIFPETARIAVKNFFSNIAFPKRFVNCLLQANFKGAASELGRFTLNTFVGFGGLFDPASEKEINLGKCEEDFGQTLGFYGIGQGFYIHWPIFGPSSPRDTIGSVADGFLNPFIYVDPWYTSTGTNTVDTINEMSFRIGDYESLKEAAIDPYVAMRDGYVQYRYHKVKPRE